MVLTCLLSQKFLCFVYVKENILIELSLSSSYKLSAPDFFNLYISSREISFADSLHILVSLDNLCWMLRYLFVLDILLRLLLLVCRYN